MPDTNIKDLSGVRFGRLIVQWPVGRDKSSHWWLCLCDCGVIKPIRQGALSTRNSKSCGCLQRDRARLQLKEHHPIKHGHSGSGGSKTYNSWRCMLARCYLKSTPGWHRYGGKGIKVYDRWRGAEGFANFLSDMGLRPEGKTIDRYPNNNGDYEPSNCRWATMKEQQNNRSNNIVRRHVA